MFGEVYQHPEGVDGGTASQLLMLRLRMLLRSVNSFKKSQYCSGENGYVT